MPVEVRFRQLHPWSLAPRQHKVDRQQSRDHAAVFRGNFRFVRAERQPEHCAPWVMGQELGWRVHSPIDISFTPLDQIELDGANEPEAAGRAVNRTELWQREKSHLAVEKTSWLHLYQFKTARGWENMFLPNGAGTVEWRLGWAADIPRGHFLLVLPLEKPVAGLDVPTGILSSTATTRMSRENGLGIAVRPTEPVAIRRGQEIARIVLLHADSLQVQSLYEETGEADVEEDIGA
ncbi:hypothetical protein [Streptomyces sp. TBY4]|uniref:hypothetical protein n=1 Tax=Streptomyces sp. TBY4 TaxID=2962030 RepID=UPI0020B75E28|nr:hypothetical protein [Streptomyces sp. TBY4]MCP3760641.1 hypothetical protein [Streptomyces sp. TBY4]